MNEIINKMHLSENCIHVLVKIRPRTPKFKILHLQKYSSFVDADIFRLCRKYHNKGERRFNRIGFVIEIMHFNL